MTIVFYRYNGEINKINKTFVTLKTITNAKPYNALDLQNPYIIVDYDSTIVNANYVQIDGNYYHVNSPALNTGQRLEFTLTKDVLASNATEIMNMDVIIDRSGDNYNSYIFDGKQKEQVNYTTFAMNIGEFSYNNGSIVLAVIGGS